MRWNDWVLLVLLMIVLGVQLFYFCLFPFTLELVLPKEDRFSRNYISWLIHGDIEKAKAYLNPSLQSQAAEGLPKITSGLNQLGGLESLQLLNVTYLTIGNGPKNGKRLVYWADFNKGSLLLQVVLHPVENGFVMDVFEKKPLPLNFKKETQFIIGGKSIFHYFFLFASVLVIGFIFLSLRDCLRMEGWKKWIWFPFILFGVGKIGLNWAGTSWSDTVFQFRPLGLQLLGSGFFKANLMEPWTVWVSFPLGAILFYFFRAKSYAKKENKEEKHVAA